MTVASPGKSKKVKKTAARRDPLAQYKGKRDFSKTAEPEGKRGRGTDWGFVVQRHDARRIHYDLRLELGGTLKSWAVTRGPNLNPSEKRLAVRTEDHPLQYLDFEGNIPKGEYGGGAMIVWDRGRWEPAVDPEFGLSKGHLEFTLHGERLHGRWHLVRMKPRRGETRENWLLIKAEDEFARTVDAEITEQETGSLVSGLTTQQLAAQPTLRTDHAGRAKVKQARAVPLPDPGELRGARKGILPAFLEPSLPQVTAKAPSGPKWVHEIKHDGYRVQARIDGTKVQLLTRKGLDWTTRFKSIETALKSLGLSAALLDGEIVVEDTSGHASFSALQADLSAGRTDRMRYLLFDILYCEGFDLTACTLGDRKALLAQVLQRADAGATLHYSEHLEQDGPTVFEHASRLGLEGIVSKRIDLPYRAGRGDHWLKLKGVLRQEFILLGYVPSTAVRGAVGALLLGYYDDDRKLRYAGRVGTGYSIDLATTLRGALDEVAAGKPKLANALPDGAEKGVRWAAPKLVAEIEFRGWSSDRIVRQSSFKGLREDRPAEEVTLEIPPEQARPGQHRPAKVRDANANARLTHPERILWGDPGITKQGLAEFYTEIADWLLPHLKGRVLSLVRCPSGVAAKCFFAKHAWNGLGPSLARVDVGEKDAMLVLDSLEGIIELVQASVLEIHPWGSRFAHLEQPDRLIFDLDPGEGVTWGAVIEAAHEVRTQLEYDSLASFVKTSGGKGLHVVVPIEPSATWDEAKRYTQSVAERMAAAQPQRYLATMSKSARRGRIFVDYLRNGRGATAVAPYSTRALPRASVSTPLAWEELSEAVRADHFRIDNLRQRLDVLTDDPWPDFFTLRQRLPVEKKRR
jgi:bifunctional non-homologous end joining protein LigD